MYARRIEGRKPTFDFAAGLLHDNLLLVDRETQSVWSQLQSKAVQGTLAGEPLRVVPSLQTTWMFWRRLHPQTRVWVVESEVGRPYRYADFRPGTRFERKPEHDTSALGRGRGEEAMFFRFRDLEKVETPLRLELGGARIVVHFEKDALTAWAEDLEGNLLPGVLAYERGWKDFNPGSRLFRAPE